MLLYNTIICSIKTLYLKLQHFKSERSTVSDEDLSSVFLEVRILGIELGLTIIKENIDNDNES